MSERDALDDATLHAYADDRLSPERRAEVEAVLLRDAETARRVEAWMDEAEALRAHAAAELDEPVPARLRAVFAPYSPWQRWRRIALRAAAVLVLVIGAGGAGWWGRGALAPEPAVVTAQPLGREATRAHLVYSAEVRHPVEVTAAEEQHLVAWLSKRLGTQLKVPALGAHGFNLIGGRLLPAASRGIENDVAAQFMYENRRGDRLTLYVRCGEKHQDSAFRFAQNGDVGGFYWTDGGYGYALAGRMEREALLPLARAVYEQIN